MLVFEQWGDSSGAPRICMICDEQWTARELETRAFIGTEYIGHVCAGCVAADPDVLVERLQFALGEVRDRARQLEAIGAWALSVSPKRRRQAFRVVGGTASRV